VDNIAEVGIDNVEEVSEIGQCIYIEGRFHRGKEAHGTNPFVCLYITESISTKANRGSCWIKSVMVSPSHSAMHTLTHTYSIAIGPLSESHDCVEEFFLKKLIMIKDGMNASFYHGGLKRNITV
jgi:hypothetical protein